MTREEIWEKLRTEIKLRGYSPLTINTYKAGITAFLDWCNKPYEDLDEEDAEESEDGDEEEDESIELPKFGSVMYDGFTCRKL